VTQNILNSFINPNDAALALQALVKGANLYATFLRIGMALIALFAMLEIYRLWMRGGGLHDLFVLGIKIAILSYLLTPSVGGRAPLEAVVMTAYGYFARLGQSIATTIGGQQFNDLWTTLNTLSANITLRGTGNFFQQIAAFGEILLSALMMMAVFGLFLLVFMIVLAIYVFTVLASRMFLLASILLAPLLLPFVLWQPMGSFISKWVSTTLHAFFLPVIGAVTLVVALSLGLVTPLKDWVQCVQATTGPAYQCIGQQMSSFVTAIMGGLVAIFIMLSVDRVVSSFLGAAEVTATGLIAARWVSSSAGRVAGRFMDQGGQGGARSVRVTERNLDTGDTRRLVRTTEPVKTPQA
jgi:hypothetical protein